MYKHDNTPIWILAYPRTGSNNLCGYFNRSGVKPHITEYYNSMLYPYYKYKISTHKNNSFLFPYRNKVLPFQMSLMKNEFDIDFEDILKNISKDTFFIYLDRKDLIGKLTSLYIALENDVFTLDENLKRYNCHNKTICNYKFNGDKINVIRFVSDEMSIHNPIDYWEKIIDQYSINCHKIYYEDLNINKLKNIFRLCGIDENKAENVYINNSFNKIRDKIPEEYLKVRKIIEEYLKNLKKEFKSE